MKTATALVFLIFAFTTKSYFFGVANAANKPVLDIEGDELRTGVPYYVTSYIWGAGGGGLALGRIPEKPCPEIVVQRQSDLDDGIPVIFSNADGSDDVVRVDEDLNIEFVPIVRDKLCSTSTVWTVNTLDIFAAKFWVITGGVKGNPGPLTYNNWFRVEQSSGYAYTFKFCPSVCGFKICPSFCSDIGRFTDNGQMRLALSSNGWPFIFKKANSDKTIKQVVN